LGVVEYPNNDGFASGLLQSTTPVERDRFVAHLYQARREYRRTCETAGKSGKRIDRCVISTFQIAESIRFEEFRQWEDLLRFGEYRLAIPVVIQRPSRIVPLFIALVLCLHRA
jgi:hypothetical protein